MGTGEWCLLLLEGPEAIPGHLLHQDAAIALCELATVEVIKALEPGAGHESVTPHLQGGPM